MKKPKLGDLFFWKNKLAKIVAMADQPTVVIEMYEPEKCPHCNGCLEKIQFSVIPTSPLFQENAEPITNEQTISFL